MGGVPQSCRRTRVGIYRFSFVTHEDVSENPRNSEKIMLRTLLICFNIHRTQHQQQWLECLSLLLRRQRRSTVRYFQCITRKEPAWSFSEKEKQRIPPNQPAIHCEPSSTIFMQGCHPIEVDIIPVLSRPILRVWRLRFPDSTIRLCEWSDINRDSHP